MEEQFERERSAKVRERYIDEKGGHGGAVPAAFSESTVWRSVLLGARATVSAKAAAGNLLVRPRIVPPFPSFCYFRRIFVSSFLIVLLLRLVTRCFLIVFHLQTDAAVEDAFSRLFQQRTGTRSLGYLSLSALRRRRGSAASACVCA